MKILLVHNFYGSEAPSGENQVFEAEKNLLLEYGHEVEEFTRHSDEIRSTGWIGLITGALSTPFNPFSVKLIREKIKTFKPAILHVHNTFPLISPSIFYGVGGDAAVVLTLHNYRLFCPAAIPMRDGKICTECLDRQSVLPALNSGCYRGSRFATIPLATNVALHRWLGTWNNNVDAFITLTEFQRRRVVEAGLSAGRTFVKPNFYPGSPKVVPWSNRRPRVVFVGRLTAEKGVEALVRAWLNWGESAPELCIAGDGPLRTKLAQLAAKDLSVPIRFLGQLESTVAHAEISQARLLVLPSECFEGFPMVVREAFAFGTPVAVADIGPLASLVQDRQNGILFQSANPDSLLRVIKRAWGEPGLLEALGGGARLEFEAKYTSETNYKMLMDIYREAISMFKGNRLFYNGK